MPTIHQESGFTFRFYSNDHLPMHVHAIHGGKECVFLLGEVDTEVNAVGETILVILEAPSIRENKSLKPTQVRRALEIVEAHQQKMILAWHDHLG